MQFLKGTLCIALFFFFVSCTTQKKFENLHKTNNPKREFRAAWVATVANIDWPSAKGLSSENQQNEFKNILNLHQKNGLNAIMVQVRTASDALYANSVEPWSASLSGEVGKAPKPFYDPLRFMIEESHQRNLEFHAWFNLDRGTFKSITKYPESHITNQKPNWFYTYGGQKYYNFGMPEVRNYIKKLVVNVVKTYDVDGIHFDDYFYPYTIEGETIADSAAFQKYGSGFASIEDWRRDNINQLVKDISESIAKEKYWVKFGISPFGVWRNATVDPNGSETQAGQTSYDNLFADTKLWMKNGWIDYILPQIYFSMEHPKVPFEKLSDWWLQNKFDRNLYIGHGVYKVNESSTEKGWNDVYQMSRQIAYIRSKPQIYGSAFYNTSAFKKNNLGFADSVASFYQTVALQPLMPWKKVSKPVSAPKNVRLNKVKTGNELTWSINKSEEALVQSFVIYRFLKNEKINSENPKNILAIVRNAEQMKYVDSSVNSKIKYQYAVSSLDRLHNESALSLAQN